MKKNYDRKSSTQVAVRFPHDVLSIIEKSPVAGESFSQKLFRFVRKHGEPKGKPKK